MSDKLEHLFADLTRLFATPGYGGRTVQRLSRMADGHAGHTYGLELSGPDGRQESYILKMGPPGVPRRGSADIFRQAPLLKALHAQGLPVPDVRWASPDEEPLGAPFIVMQRLPGRTLIIWDPDPSFPTDAASLARLWIAGAGELARIHRLPHDHVLAHWEQPTTLRAELDRWRALVKHSEDPSWQRDLHVLADALVESMPGDAPAGLVHGDFQPGNILFDGQRISGIVDWDLAVIGPQGLDLGWYLMMAGRECWHPDWRPGETVDRADILTAYADAGGPALADVDWHQSFAQFRFSAIAGLNLKLHRNGKRVDAIWEQFALSVPVLTRSALAILSRKDCK
jgi:aminoglycoside phosphotransferase (APT) family kinase protein